MWIFDFVIEHFCKNDACYDLRTLWKSTWKANAGSWIIQLVGRINYNRREKIKGEEIRRDGGGEEEEIARSAHTRAGAHTHTPVGTRQWLPRDHVQHGRPRTTTIISELSHEFSPCRNRVYGHLCSATNVAAAAVAALDRAIDDAVVFHFVNIIMIPVLCLRVVKT